MSSLCGCYFYVASAPYQRQQLPLLSSEVHSNILSTTSRTNLKQTFTNPSSTGAIKRCTYTFPLYDGVSVVSFTCRIGAKVLTGLVKEKAKAKEIFDQAVAKGETAGLLSQAAEVSDVFSTKLGNIPAGESVIVDITYIGELKHHETDGIRFTIPTKIAPRYGNGSSHGFSEPHRSIFDKSSAISRPNMFDTSSSIYSPDNNAGQITITVDIKMPEGSFIKGVQSPSHPIAMSMGALSTSINDEPSMSKASARLSLGSTALDKDFVLIIQSKDVGIPKAILETHPDLPNQTAIMATLVPKFSLPPSVCEIVFVADRSGSMRGNIEMLVSAMKVFFKSLPQSTMFNICSFGSHHSFLWEKSRSVSRDAIQQATDHLKHFSADMRGTEIFGAIKGTIEQRLSTIPLEIILLTDGDIHRQNELFDYVNEQVKATEGKIRVFPLGIGNGVSHSLIEGLARAGNGFAQAVQLGERLDNAVVRMLRGALSPHITDYTMEVRYETDISDDYELVDRVTEGMKVLLTDETKSLKSCISSSSLSRPMISLYDPNLEPEKDLQVPTVALPSIPTPKLLQAPHKIPTLFAFLRTTVYLLVSPEAIQRKPIAVVLRGTSEHGPLALEIPIDILSSSGETIHQLAAKKGVQDLEEGRGWIYDAKDQDGVSVRDKYTTCFDDLVQREAVRLGEKFQVAGKWCSFVAVAANDAEIAERKRKAAAGETPKSDTPEDQDPDDDFEFLATPSTTQDEGYDMASSYSAMPRAAFLGDTKPAGRSKKKHLPAQISEANAPRPGGAQLFSASSNFDLEFSSSPVVNQNGLFGSSATPPPPPPYMARGGLDAALQSANARGPPGSSAAAFHASSPVMPASFGAPPSFGRMQTSTRSSAGSAESAVSASRGGRGGYSGGMKGFRQRVLNRDSHSKRSADAESDEIEDLNETPTPIDWATKSNTDKVLALIDLQDFEGWWPITSSNVVEISKITGVKIAVKATENETKMFVTMLVIKFLEVRCIDEEGTWAMVVEKGRKWLKSLDLKGTQLQDLEDTVMLLI